MTGISKWWVTWIVLMLAAPLARAQDDEEDPDEAEAEADDEEEGDEEEAPARDCPVPDQVAVGAFVNNLQALDITTHTYEVDFYVWFKWCNADLDPATTLEFMNASELWGLMITPTYEEPETLPDGSLHQVLRVQGRFSTKMPLYDYPFDRQLVGPKFEDSQSNADALVYVADTAGVALDPELTLPGYLLGEPSLDLQQRKYQTTFGDTREPPVYSRAQIGIPLSRPLASQLTLLLVPLLSVMSTSALMFLLNRYWVDSRVAVGTTAMLTLVALQITYNQEFADVGYLMLMDKIYLASYLYVISGLAVVVRTSPRSYEAGAEDPLTARRTLPSMIVTTAIYLLVCLVLILGAAF